MGWAAQVAPAWLRGYEDVGGAQDEEGGVMGALLADDFAEWLPALVRGIAGGAPPRGDSHEDALQLGATERAAALLPLSAPAPLHGRRGTRCGRSQGLG